MNVVVNADSCIGCGLCAQVAPDVYEMSGDKAVVKTGFSEASNQDAKTAAEQCPVNAIEVS